MPLWLISIDAVLNDAWIGRPSGRLASAWPGLLCCPASAAARAHISVVGVVIILAAAAMWAAGTIIARRVTLPSSPALATGMQLLCGGVALLALPRRPASSARCGWVRCRRGPGWPRLPDRGRALIAFSAYGIAVRTLPTATVATYAYVNPVIAVLLGTLILNERLTRPCSPRRAHRGRRGPLVAAARQHTDARGALTYPAHLALQQAGQQDGDDAGDKDAVEGARAADGQHRRAQNPGLRQVDQVGAHLPSVPPT